MAKKKATKKKTLRKAGKPAAKKPQIAGIPKTPVSRITPEQQIVGAVFLGKVGDYYAHLGVIALVLEAPLAVGDTIRIKGHTTDLTQPVETIQVSRQNVQSASAGEAVGVRIADKARIGDAVYKC